MNKKKCRTIFLENQLVVSENFKTVFCIIRAQKLRERSLSVTKMLTETLKIIFFCDWSTFPSVHPSLDAAENVPTFTIHAGFLFNFIFRILGGFLYAFSGAKSPM